MNILFKNEHFVAVEKAAMELTVPPRFPDKDNRPILGHNLREAIEQEVYPVHRLDYEVSGVTLFALSPEAHRAASLWFENREVKKVYLAQTEVGENPPELNISYEWKCRLLRGKKRAYEHKTGKQSHTLAQCTGITKDHLDWVLEPLTGRSHQLRYELFRHGFPILGDKLYGAHSEYPEGIALRSTELEFLNAEATEKWKLPKKLKLT